MSAPATETKKPTSGTASGKPTPKVVPATPPAYPSDAPGATPPAYPADMPPTPPAYPMDTGLVPAEIATGSAKNTPMLQHKEGEVPPPYAGNMMMPPSAGFSGNAQPFVPRADAPAFKVGEKPKPAARPLGAVQPQDNTQYAAPEQNLPVVLVYGLPMAGTTTLAKAYAEQSDAVFLTSQVIDKAEPWAWSAAVLNSFQETLAAAQKPIKGIVIDFPMKTMFELSYLIQWLKEHSIPMNAAIKVEDGGSALKRAKATATNEPEYFEYLDVKYQRGSYFVQELQNFFQTQGINESVAYPQDAELKPIMLDFKLALAKARSRRPAKVCQTPPLPYNYRGLRPLLNADFYRSAMEVLLNGIWSGRKGAINIPHPDEMVGKEQWDALFPKEKEGESNGTVPLPTCRAFLGTQGLLFWHPKNAGDKRPNKLYFVPRQQQMLYTVDQSLWPFGTVTKPCVLTCSFLPGALPVETEGSEKKSDREKTKEEKGTNSVLLIEDCLLWDGASTYGKNYQTRFAILEKAQGAHYAGMDDKKEPVSFGFGLEPNAFPNNTEIVVGLHKSVPVRSLSNWRSAPKPNPKGARDKSKPWTQFQVPNVERSQEYSWSKNYGVVMFDGNANLSLWSTHDAHPCCWVPPTKVSSVLKLGAKKKSADGSEQYEVLTLVANPENPKQKDQVVAPLAEAATLTVKPEELKAAGQVDGCDCVELRWIHPRKKKEGDEESVSANNSFTGPVTGPGHWKLVKFRPDRTICDTWSSVQKHGALLPVEKQIESFSQWLKFACECVPPTSQALQELMTPPVVEEDKKESSAAAKKGKSQNGRKK